MEGGDISNEFAPTLVFDVDNLIIFTKEKMFGLFRKTELNMAAIKICEHHIAKGRMIYLLAHGRSELEMNELEEILDQYDFPYTKLFAIQTHKEREAILGRNHVHLYFYNDKLHAATDNKRKERYIMNIAESYF